ncbi:putative transmembrane protein [Halotydeus destructor]|nr:putative transmembrane protein [Halotydeus destructor]
MYYFVCLVLFIFLRTSDAAIVTLTNDGPVVYGAPITFTATLDHAFDYYIYEFQDAKDPSKKKDVTGYESAKASFTYTIASEGKNNMMIVRVWFTIFGSKAWIIEKSHCQFEVSGSLIGNLDISQTGVPQSAIDKSIVARSVDSNVTLNLSDPSKFFSDFNMTYTWTISDAMQNTSFTNLSSVLTYNFPSPSSTVSVIVKAENNQKNMTRFGNFEKNIRSKEVISDLKVTGKTWITRDRNLNLSVSCIGGDSPYSFCRSLFSDNASASQNFSCPEIHTITDVCDFQVIWYFRESGKYYLVMLTSNDVSVVTRKFEINVVDIDKQAQLSFVIIPVSAIIMVIIIVMSGIAYHLRQRQQLVVEEADFDFQQRREDLIEKTFVERIKESLSASLAKASGSRVPTNPTPREPYQDLMDDNVTDNHTNNRLAHSM